jgi:tetratricopeptide (TPR) repeat protein
MVLQLGSDAPEDRKLAEGQIARVPLCETDLLEQLLKDEKLPAECRQQLEVQMKFIRPRRQHLIEEYQRMSRIFDWACKAAIDSYDKGQHHQATWDDTVHRFLHAAWVYKDPRLPPASYQTPAQVVKDIQPVLDEGCDDPGVLVTAFMRAVDSGTAADKVVGLLKRAASGKSEAAVNPAIAMMIDGRLIRTQPLLTSASDKLDEKELKATLDDLVQQMLKLESMPDLPAYMAAYECNSLITAGDAMNASRKELFDQVFPKIEARFPNDHDVLACKGKQYMQIGWQARGGGLGNTVTPDGWKALGDDMAIANEALSKAYQLDPTDEGPPTDMLSVCMAQGPDRAAMELWYKRAMQANPDNFAACFQKAQYLLPRWYGSQDEAIAFGKELVDQGDWAGCLPMVLYHIHRDVSGTQEEGQKHFKDPKVWEDMNFIFSEYLQRFPDDKMQRVYFALAAYSCAQWKVADAQFSAVGDSLDPRLQMSREQFNACRDFAHKKAGGH